MSRRKLQFGVGILVLLMLAMATTGGVVIHVRYRYVDQLRAVNELRHLGATLSIQERTGPWRHVLEPDLYCTVLFVEFERSRITPEIMERIGRLFTLLQLIIVDSNVDGVDFCNMEHLPELESVDLQGSNVSDDALEHLSHDERIDELVLDGTRITDEGLRSVAHMTRLVRLSLKGTKITDAGLVHLAALPDLLELHLEDTDVTDASIPTLAALGSGNRLYLSLDGSLLSDEGYESLREKMPDCTVLFCPRDRTVRPSSTVKRPEKP